VFLSIFSVFISIIRLFMSFWVMDNKNSHRIFNPMAVCFADYFSRLLFRPH
jgi:hypothetical protein